MIPNSDSPECWPPLPLLAEWQGTYDTLHMWTQMVGKVRLALSPNVNHWWHSALYVTPRGLATSAIPFRDRTFELEFDFIDHRLMLRTSDGAVKSLPLVPQTVADFYGDFMAMLKSAGFEVLIWKMPVEVADPIAFDKDTVHASYDRAPVKSFFRALSSINTVFQHFRSGFLGKSSPVHFFWGSFDLAVTRFSGKRTPARPGADHVTLEAYSHEVISGGFWPGGGDVKGAAFYSYAAPAPEGYAKYKVSPAKAYFDTKLGEYLLSYDDLRRESSPSKALMEFLQTTYEAGAIPGKWDRQALERTL
ncbi:MAG TPA: DUF5996 family protein [Terriglobales bacterium]|nr:DUF5996 family protein [Terriglobales bacterium]